MGPHLAQTFIQTDAAALLQRQRRLMGVVVVVVVVVEGFAEEVDTEVGQWGGGAGFFAVSDELKGKLKILLPFETVTTIGRWINIFLNAF